MLKNLTSGFASGWELCGFYFNAQASAILAGNGDTVEMSRLVMNLAILLCENMSIWFPDANDAAVKIFGFL